MNPTLVPTQTFEHLVVDALDALPPWLLPIVDEIAVLVEDEPDPDDAEQGLLCLGLYRGVPRTSHPGRVPGSLPDTITLYRIPVLLACDSPDDVPERVRIVLIHEVGHAMGLTESRLRSLGWQ